MTVTSPIPNESAHHEVVVNWYRRSKIGQKLISQLSITLDKSLEQVFGYHMLLIGADIGLEFSRIGKTQSIVRLTGTLDSSDSFQPIIGTSNELPFAADSIDALIVCHALDTSPWPHDVLRECHRVLVPNGHLFVLAMNPFSLSGLWRLSRNFLSRKNVPRVSPVSTFKLRDWLSLLGFVFNDPKYHVVVPPLGKGSLKNLLERLDAWLVSHNVPLGTGYVIHARKRVYAHSGPTPRSFKRPRLISISLGEAQGGIPVRRETRCRDNLKIESPQ